MSEPSEPYVRNEETGEIVAHGTLQQCVKEARARAVSGKRFGVYKDNIFGSPAKFNVYPDADIEWRRLQRAGLVPRDS